jgi:hypothetical protein
VAEFFIIGERFLVITRQLQAAEVLSKLSIMNDKSSFVKDPLVMTEQLAITKQLKLYFNNSSRIPTPVYFLQGGFISRWFQTSKKNIEKSFFKLEQYSLCLKNSFKVGFFFLPLILFDIK